MSQEQPTIREIQMSEIQARLKAGGRSVKKATNSSAAIATKQSIFKSIPAGVYVFVFVLAGFLAQSGFSGYQEFDAAQKQMTVNSETLVESESERSAVVLKQWIESSHAPAKVAVLSSDIDSMDPVAAGVFLKKMGATQTQVQLIAMVNPSGQQIIRNDTNKLISISERRYFKSALKGTAAFDFLISKITNKLTLLYGDPIYRPAVEEVPSEVIGVLMSGSDIAQAAPTIFQKFGKTGRTMLLDTDAKILFSADRLKEGVLMGDEYLDRPLTGKASTLNFFGQAVRISESRIGNGYTVVSMIDEAEIQEPLSLVKLSIIKSLALNLVVALLIAFILGGAASRAIKRFALIVDRASKAQTVEEIVELESELQKGLSTSEITFLSRSVKRLLSSVKIALKNNT